MLSKSLTKAQSVSTGPLFTLNSITDGQFTLAATMTLAGKSSAEQTRPNSISKLAEALTRTGHPCATREEMRRDSHDLCLPMARQSYQRPPLLASRHTPHPTPPTLRFHSCNNSLRVNDLHCEHLPVPFAWRAGRKEIFSRGKNKHFLREIKPMMAQSNRLSALDGITIPHHRKWCPT